MDSNNIDLIRPAIYIVGTPIGNLSDFSVRGQRVLHQSDLVLAEDTRKSRYLLDRYQIKSKIVSYHAFSETRKVNGILEMILQKPAAVALVTDSGTPLISDPGFRLVKTGVADRVPIIPIPGPSALIACLSISDLPADKFVFEGFLPSKESARVRRLEELKLESRSMVFYEAPHRILKFLKSIENVMGEKRRVVVAREMTKLHETIYRGFVYEVLKTISESSSGRKGEFTVIVEGAVEVVSEIEDQIDKWLGILLKEVDIKTSVRIVNKITKARKNLIYERALNLAK